MARRILGKPTTEPVEPVARVEFNHPKDIVMECFLALEHWHLPPSVWLDQDALWRADMLKCAALKADALDAVSSIKDNGDDNDDG